jgi:6-pyruvoyltetrahydropterin/6-carboxytetrahydropterin synthase
VLEVTVKGTADPHTGMIMNLNTLEKYINDEIIDWVDHKNLTDDIPVFKETLPTVENMVMIFWNKLRDVLPADSLYKISLQETEDNRAEYTG